MTVSPIRIPSIGLSMAGVVQNSNNHYTYCPGKGLVNLRYDLSSGYAAASVTFVPKAGSRSSFKVSPGWGGVKHSAHFESLSVIVLIIDQHDITIVECESDAPVAIDHD